jgi:hypothetical protein
VVFIDRPPGDIDAAALLPDNAGGARAVTKHAVTIGVRRALPARAGDLEVAGSNDLEPAVLLAPPPRVIVPTALVVRGVHEAAA